MKSKLQTKRQEGFTIIEVLIVLAIAGLIILIVFLAVPALQRNSRNTQARSEASNVLAALSEFVSNNNGKLPAAGSSSTANSEAAQVFSNAKLSNITTVTVEGQSGTTTPTGTLMIIRTGAKCTAPTGSTNTPAGGARQVALLYQIENSGGPIVACQES